MTDYDKQAADFCAKYGLTVKITRAQDNTPPPWAYDGGIQSPHGDKYIVSIRRKDSPRSLSFAFWGSYADTQEGKDPSVYHVLACTSSDIYTPETFAEFCSEYGYDGDSRKALATFKRCDRQARRLRVFFADEAERAALSEIC